MYTDYVMNGTAYGQVGEFMQQNLRWDPGLRRPYIDENGVRCVTVNTGRFRYDQQLGIQVPIYQKERLSDVLNAGINIPYINATSLSKDDWIMLDTTVVRAARQRLRAWSDLAASNTFGMNGMSKMILEHQTLSDPGEARADMDGMTEGNSDSPLFQLEGLPLPITHSDFMFSERVLAVSRNSGQGLDTIQAEAAGRRVAELIEKTTIGTVTGVTYGINTAYGRTPSVYGYRNFPARVTKTDMTTPNASNGTTVLSEWLALRDLMYAANFYGPFMVYTSTAYDQYLDNDFKAESDKTTRQRLQEIDGIQGIRRLDFLSGVEVMFVQMTQEVARAVMGMDVTTLMWESMGGLRMNFKVMAIMVPQLRADYNGNCGIGHGTTS